MKRGGCLSRLLVALAVVAVVAVASFLVVPPFRAAVRTAALIPELLELPVRPLSALTPAPTRIAAVYGDPRPERMDIYLPAGAAPDGSRPAVLLSLGIHPLPLDHPAVVRVASGIARLGIVLGVPESERLRDAHVTPAEPRRLADAFLVLAARPEVDLGRIGIAGFSAGASLGLVASSDARIRDRVAYVHAFGGYADAELLVTDVVTRTMVLDGAVRDWIPGRLSRRTILELLLEVVDDPGDRDRLRQRAAGLADERPPAPLVLDPVFAGTLGDDARAAYRLLTASSRAEAEAVIAVAPPELRAELAAVSPVRSASVTRAEVFLMHDEADDAIAVSHVHEIARSVPAERLRRLTVMRLFRHIQPEEGGVGLEDAPELWKLFLHLQDVLQAAAD